MSCGVGRCIVTQGVFPATREEEGAGYWTFNASSNLDFPMSSVPLTGRSQDSVLYVINCYLPRQVWGCYKGISLHSVSPPKLAWEEEGGGEQELMLNMRGFATPPLITLGHDDDYSCW